MFPESSAWATRLLYTGSPILCTLYTACWASLTGWQAITDTGRVVDDDAQGDNTDDEAETATGVVGRAVDDVAKDWKLVDGDKSGAVEDEAGAVEMDCVAKSVLTRFVDFCTKQSDYEC